jgi:hypothetical protein
MASAARLIGKISLMIGLIPLLAAMFNISRISFFEAMWDPAKAAGDRITVF